MRVVTLIAIALLFTSVSFASDSLDRIPGMSGSLEIMDELGLIDHDATAKKVVISKPKKAPKKTPETIKIRQLADTMSTVD